jgi:transposase
LDEVRREAWNHARCGGHTRGNGRGRRDATGPARAIARSRYALWKNPENLTDRQQAKLARIARTDPRLYRAYLLKEGLRLIFQLPAADAHDALERWIGWARRSRTRSFVTL